MKEWYDFSRENYTNIFFPGLSKDKYGNPKLTSLGSYEPRPLQGGALKTSLLFNNNAIKVNIYYIYVTI